MPNKFVSTLSDYKLQYLKEFEQRNKHLTIPTDRLFKVVENTLSKLKEPISWNDFKNYFDGSHWQESPVKDATEVKANNYTDNRMPPSGSDKMEQLIREKVKNKVIADHLLGMTQDERRKHLEGFRTHLREKEKSKKREANLQKLERVIDKVLVRYEEIDAEQMWIFMERKKITFISKQDFLSLFNSKQIQHNKIKSKPKPKKDTEYKAQKEHIIKLEKENEIKAKNEFELLKEEIINSLPKPILKIPEPKLGDYELNFFSIFRRNQIVVSNWFFIILFYLQLLSSIFIVSIHLNKKSFTFGYTYLILTILLNLIFDYSGKSEYIKNSFKKFEKAKVVYEENEKKIEVFNKKYNTMAYKLSHGIQASWLSLDPYSLENKVGQLFEHLGYQVEYTSKSNDGGVDLYIDNKDESSIIQCKQHKSKIGVNYVRELYGTLVSEEKDKAYLVAPNGFSDKAYDFIKDKNIELYNVDDLVKLIYSFKGYVKRTFFSSKNLKELQRSLNKDLKRGKKSYR